MAKARSPRSRDIASEMVTFPRANGVLALSFGFAGAYQKVHITGGPFDGYPKGNPHTFGVCVRQERVPEHADLVVPIVDFQVPTAEQYDLVASAVLTAFDAAFGGRDVYVGCMGGMGRTGLFLAIMAKCAGIPDPVQFVRKNYYSHAVETENQLAYVNDFDIKPITHLIHARAWRHKTRRFFGDVARSFNTNFKPQ
jgi:hypothetical protein